jgi:hypothetical protein
MTPAPAFAILEGANQPRSETMRAVLFHAQSTGRPKDWNEFIHRVSGFSRPQVAEELAPGVWFLPLPDCQGFLDNLKGLLQRPLPVASSRMLEFDYAMTWQTLS